MSILSRGDAIDTSVERPRKYPRHKAPKGTFVAWKAGEHQAVSRAETVAMGGLFLHTDNPRPQGTTMEVLVDLKAGEVRARATVRYSVPGKGMGVQFVQMQPTDRARLTQFLAKCASAGAESIPKPEGGATTATPPPDSRKPEVSDAPDEAAFEREMKELLALAETGTYYQLLRVTAESPRAQARLSFHEIVRKFHPDLHMDHVEWMQTLHKIMETATLAYRTLTDDTARRKYDERLAAHGTFTLGRKQSELQRTAEECMQKARECFRAQNTGGVILWLRKAVEIEPESFKHRALLARALSAMEPFRREAVEHFEKALEINGSNTNVRFQLAALYEEMKLPWRARLHYQKVLEIDRDNTKAQERLRLLDAETGMSKRSFIDRIFRGCPT
jgi:Flp pilus assembly protein TadD